MQRNKFNTASLDKISGQIQKQVIRSRATCQHIFTNQNSEREHFFKIYKNVLRLENMAMVQYSGLLLFAPRISTTVPDIGSLLLSSFNKKSRTFVGSTELLDSVYQPKFSIDSRYRHYFEPTMLTDGDGDLCDTLHQDLINNVRRKYRVSGGDSEMKRAS